MSNTIDNLGEWHDLGTEQPLHDVFVPFGIQTIKNLKLFRFTFNCSDFKKINSYILVRARYLTNQSNIVGRAIRVYPQEDRTLIDLPIPESLENDSTYTRLIEIKKYCKRLRYVGLIADIDYSVKVEEFIDTELTNRELLQQDSEQISIIYDIVSNSQ